MQERQHHSVFLSLPVVVCLFHGKGGRGENCLSTEVQLVRLQWILLGYLVGNSTTTMPKRQT